MQDCVRRATPLAIALVFAVSGGVSAGDNADATFSLLSPSEYTDIGSGGSVTVEIAASGLVGMKQFQINIAVSPADAFDLASASFTPEGGLFGLPEPGDGVIGFGFAKFGGAGIDGDWTFGVAEFPMAASFTTDTEATITVTLISVGPDTENRDNFDAEALGFTITINPPPPPVVEPTLTTTSAADESLEFSAIGDGDAADGSSGEVTFSISFTDASEAAAAGQEITWTVSNSGAESVFVLGETEVAAGGEAIVTTTTDAEGAASITLDAEGGQAAGSTSASVSAATSADNSEGESRSLSQSFSATWDVAVPAELASFAAQIGVERDVLLQWAVPSQSNNLGWEVYRSIDETSYELVSQLISGDGTTDLVRAYQFVDANPPLVDVVFYYLKQIDLDGSSSRSRVLEVVFSPTAVSQIALPTASSLGQNYPNPFNPETTISFDLANEAQVSLTIYDLTGQQVIALVSNEAMAAGTYRRLWDGRNSEGTQVASGVYFFELKAGAFSSKRKMILVQ